MREDRGSWLLVILAVLAMAFMMWMLSRQDAHAETVCPAGWVTIRVWTEDGQRCKICRLRLHPHTEWQSCRSLPPRAEPLTATPTKRAPVEEEPTDTPTVASTATPTPTATRRLAVPPPPEPPEEEPTWTTTPDAPEPSGSPTSSVTIGSTREPTAISSPMATSTPIPTPTRTTLQPIAATRARKPTILPCLPEHAARPVALCDTRSGSGWWLYFIGDGRIEAGPHVPYPSAAMAGRRVVLKHYISGEPLELAWGSKHLQVRTAYSNGKVYAFRVDAQGRVEILSW